jgi:hypothetical protein
VAVPPIAAEEKRCFIISHINNKTEIEDATCTLLHLKARELSELGFVSFKVSVNKIDYTMLMSPEV